MNWFSTQSPLILGHRGASAAAPENTMAAFALALEQGALGFEFDVQLSSDGVAVIVHDDTVDRTTNGTGRVGELTLAELQALDAGDGEQIPTLESVFKEFGQRALYNVEIKDHGWRDDGTEAAVARLIEQYDVAEQCLVSSFSPVVMRRVRPLLSSTTPTAMLRFYGLQQYSYHLFSGEADHPHFSMVNGRYMAWARQHGYMVNVWTLDEPAVAKRLVSLGVHGIITNTPERLISAFQ